MAKKAHSELLKKALDRLVQATARQATDPEADSVLTPTNPIRCGESVVVTMKYLDVPIWVVPNAATAVALALRGLPRWSIWTLHEVQDFVGAFGSEIRTVSDAAAVLHRGSHAAG